MSEDKASFLPPRQKGLAVLKDGSLKFHNSAMLKVLTDHDEQPEEAGRKRLKQLLGDPEVMELVSKIQQNGPEGEIEISPTWWPGQIIGVTAGKADGDIFLSVSNWTIVHRLANMQQDFVANVSHELRTPLTSIRMAAESLQMGAMANENMRAKFASNIQREAERLTRLVNELLVVANLHGRPILHCTEFNLLDLAHEVISTLEPHADLNHVKLPLIVPEVLPKVKWDRDRIHQVLINLVDNAIKFTPAQGSVTLAIDPTDPGIVIKVTDTGIGIPEIDRPRIFDRFYRVDKSRSRVTGGVGLGLSIVKDIIVAHRGTIEVESEINVGTTFIIMLPLDATQQAQ
jgi:two-component system phosphate regulon sensor histidine kinase PhoR